MPSQAEPPARDTDFSDYQSPHEASVDRLVKALDRAYHRPWLMMWRAFLQGICAALGATVGTALILILFVHFFQALGGIGLLKPYIDQLNDLIIQSQTRSVSNLIGNTTR